jgi:lysyl-tRNA synthetase class 1
MRNKIIGHGTWYDKIALDVVNREKQLNRGLNLIRTESGIGASGIPHIGSLADAARSHAVSLAIGNLGYPSELVAFSDDKDGLRKIPRGFPSKLKKYLGFPVTSIPDPFGNCHTSFGEHMSSLLLESLETCGIQYRFMSGTEAYKEGLLNRQIELLLRNAKRIGEIVREEVGQEKYEDALPYFPVCQRCGRIYTTKAYEFLPKEMKILYDCEGMEVGRRWLEGCGYKGEIDYRLGEGKLSWKAGEFAARWAALGICFEAYGKDIADSVRVNDRICREILGFEPPIHVQYEMFLDKGGKKISKSRGNVFTPQLWFRYGSPQSLLLLTLKRFTGTRTLAVEDIPQYMNELDELEDVFFEKRRAVDPKTRANLTGLYMYCWGLNPPEQPRVHVPYNLLINLAKVAPNGSEAEFIKEKLLSYGYATTSEDMNARIGYVLNWVEDFEETQKATIKVKGREANATAELMNILEQVESAEAIQGAIFETARKHGLKPRRFFEILYHALLSVPRGPRLGSYIVDVGRQNVINKLRKLL